MPQPGLQTIATHILSNISQSKGNQRMKFGQLIEYIERNIFLHKIMRKMRQFRYISIALNLPYNKSKLYKTLDYSSRDMLNFNFSEKGLGLVSPPHFVYDFSGKMFLMLHSIN